MKTSIIIPVWKGAPVIEQCLEALYSTADPREMFEVICVDNASNDDSASRIAQSYPQARLIRQPINLGFSGGINAGIDAATGDVLVLLNQDCIVQPGWLGALLRALQNYPEYGLMGCTILNPDGSTNHTGAVLSKPDLQGMHLIETPDGAVCQVDYATGAALAIRRQTWEKVGYLDEGFYPAYFEDVDYAYRARRKGIETGCALQAKVQHLFSSREWEAAPLRHAVITHTSRYRFACKHLSGPEIAQFFACDAGQLQSLQHMNHAVGRVIAARTTLRSLRGILGQRSYDLSDNISAEDRAQIQAGLAHIFQLAFDRAKQLVPDLPLALDAFASGAYLPQSWQTSRKMRREYSQREREILEDIFFRSPDDLTPESAAERISRRLLKRLPSQLSGRDNRLWSQLTRTQQAHIELLSLDIALLEMLTEYE